MKSTGTKWMALAGLAVLCAGSAYAETQTVPDLAKFLRTEMQKDPNEIFASHLEEYEGHSWDFTTFYFNVSPYVSFGLSTVANVTVSPEIEFIWMRE